MTRPDTAAFLALHDRSSGALLLPNPPDVGVALILQQLGCRAVATSSSSQAGTQGLLDGAVGLDACLAHATALASALEIPVHVDFENAFAHDPEGVADNVARLAATGVCSFSVEDYDRSASIYDLPLAVERVHAAVEAAHTLGLAVTARAESLLHGGNDLDGVLERLRAFAEVGADVVFAPGLRRAEEISAAVAATNRPLNVLLMHGTPTFRELDALGVARVSTGSLIHRTMLAAIEPLLASIDSGDPSMWEAQRFGAQAAERAFRSGDSSAPGRPPPRPDRRASTSPETAPAP